MRVIYPYGLNETEATNESEVHAGYNFELQFGAKKLSPRGPIDLKGTAPNGGSINGIMQLVTRANSVTTLIYADASTPTLYNWTGANTSTAFTSVRTTSSDSMLRAAYWSLTDCLTITDLRKLTPLLNWNGTACTRQKTGLGVGSTTVITSISEASGTYTVLEAGHGLVAGDLAIIAGTTNAGHNAEHEVTNVVSAGAWDYVDAVGYGASTDGTAEKGVELFAKYSVVHNGRLWLFNITTDTDENAHMILASAFEDYESFDTVTRSGAATGNEAFYTLSPDLKSINGVTSFNRQLLISTEDGAIHRLIGVDAADYQFATYYSGSAAIGEESMANIGNDVIYMRNSGNIDLLGAKVESSDVGADDISRFIPTTIHDLTESLTVYDQAHQKVFFFVGDKILVLFKDILATSQGSPWSVYKTALTDSSGSIFDTKAATYIRRPSETVYTIYFGDVDGNIYDLNGTGYGDNSTSIALSVTKPLIESTRLKILRGYIQYRRFGQFNCSVIFDWSEEYNQTICDLTLKGSTTTEEPPYYGAEVYYGGDFYYNEGFEFADTVSKQNFSPAGRSDGFFMTFYADTTVQWQVDHIELT